MNPTTGGDIVKLSSSFAIGGRPTRRSPEIHVRGVRGSGNCISLTRRNQETAVPLARRPRETPAEVVLFGRAIREPNGSLNAGSFRQTPVRTSLGSAARRNRCEQPPPSGCRQGDRELCDGESCKASVRGAASDRRRARIVRCSVAGGIYEATTEVELIHSRLTGRWGGSRGRVPTSVQCAETARGRACRPGAQSVRGVAAEGVG